MPQIHHGIVGGGIYCNVARLRGAIARALHSAFCHMHGAADVRSGAFIR